LTFLITLFIISFFFLCVNIFFVISLFCVYLFGGGSRRGEGLVHCERVRAYGNASFSAIAVRGGIYGMESGIMTIKFSKAFDLVFHVLAHMKVENASNLYNSDYTANMSKQKQKEGFAYNISSALSEVSHYYNANFDRLGMINFLPFYCADYEDMKNCFMQHKGFTQQDMDDFIKPFINILDCESEFFFPWWDKQDTENEAGKNELANRLIVDFAPFAPIFDYYKKSPQILLSYTLTANGRGFGGFPEYFTALAPFPKTDAETNSVFFTLLHEITHQVTDSLIQGGISMQDGSHDLSESIVILTDYYLIETLNPTKLNDYFSWIQAISQSNNPLNAKIFMDMFPVGDEVKTAIWEIALDICGNKRKAKQLLSLIY
jgi:hypothetical protein